MQNLTTASAERNSKHQCVTGQWRHLAGMSPNYAGYYQISYWKIASLPRFTYRFYCYITARLTTRPPAAIGDFSGLLKGCYSIHYRCVLELAAAPIPTILNRLSISG